METAKKNAFLNGKNANKGCYLYVFAAPAVIARGPTDRRVTKGTKVHLKCEAMGVPRPSIMWMKNGQPVS